MKTLVHWFVLVAVIALTLPAQADKGDLRYSIAVAKFENRSPGEGQQALAQTFSAVLTDSLQQTGRFVLGESGLLRDLNAEVRGREVRIALSADVLFDFDRADLRSEAKPSLDKVVAVLESYPKAKAKATIEGHTDSKGDDAYNRKLSERRADSVRKWLAANGASLRMSTRGWGEKKPVAPNAKPDGKDDPEGRQKNRRVEIMVKQL